VNEDEGTTPRIVVGVDGSEQSKLALRWAARLAPDLGAGIHAVAAWQLPTSLDWSVVPYDWDIAGDTETVLTKAVDEVFAERPAGLQLDVRQGNPAQVLLSLSEDATMLIVGSRGRGGFTGLLLGSVSAKCAEHARCPVLVVHGDWPPPRPADPDARSAAG
jgi:nucleotide-binding universal stress UspA family protein